jgi:acyl-CoA synthetase (NDP forming)
MMLALHFDHQEQMMSIVDMTSVSAREMNIVILQKNLIKMKNIHEKLNKLRVLYELNERRNNELML